LKIEGFVAASIENGGEKGRERKEFRQNVCRVRKKEKTAERSEDKLTYEKRKCTHIRRVMGTLENSGPKASCKKQQTKKGGRHRLRTETVMAKKPEV